MPDRRGPVPGQVSPVRVGARRDALAQARSRSARNGDGGVSARVHVSEMQRSRLLSAAVVTIAQLGYEHASVAHITARARVSRRTFYDLFANREDCLLAILDDTVARVQGELEDGSLEGLVWRERVRTGLWRVLCWLDREPALARICIEQTLRSGPRVLERRAEILARLARVLDEGRGDSARNCPPLTGEGLVGATVSILHGRLSRDHHSQLSSLLGELMGLIVLPYQGPAAARREQSRALPVPPVLTGSAHRAPGDGSGAVVDPDPLADVPMRLTYRTARVLEVIAQTPGTSNRVVAEHAGIVDQGQISKLLSRLQRLGLVENSGAGQAHGERNVWTLTATGTRVARHLSPGALDGREGGVGR